MLDNYCKNCKACEVRGNVPIKERVGNGKYMFIIDKPNKSSYETKSNFDKITEKYLINLMNASGFKSGETCFTYMVRCPVNPVAKYQIESCKRWLWQDIKETQPHTIFTFGDKVSELLSSQSEPFREVNRKLGEMEVNICSLPNLGSLISRGYGLTEKTLGFLKQCKNKKEPEISLKI